MLTLLVSLVILQSPPAIDSQQPAVYRAHFLRAAPGHLTELIEVYRARIEVLTAAGEPLPVFMRHSQGDQWDLMVLSPIGSLAEYFADARAERWDRAGFEARVRAITARQEDLFVAGPPVDTLTARNAAAGFYHVEIFRALPGQYDALVRQREMENDYYHATDRDGNLVFTRLAGSAWDCFTWDSIATSSILLRPRLCRPRCSSKRPSMPASNLAVPSGRICEH